MEIFSIGFTQKSAREFFGTLKAHGIERLLDVRLNNTSQLAAFAKQADLTYFVDEICGAVYEHEPLLAPTQEILDAYKKSKTALGIDAGVIALSFARVRWSRPSPKKASKRKLFCCAASPPRSIVTGAWLSNIYNDTGKV
jgi:hypothetical protein